MTDRYDTGQLVDIGGEDYARVVRDSGGSTVWVHYRDATEPVPVARDTIKPWRTRRELLNALEELRRRQ